MSTYLYNIWYVAAWASEVIPGTVLGRTILDIPVALFRQADGRAAAVLDRCPHRFAPLSGGLMENGSLICRYHGLGFNGGGACTRNPHGPLLQSLAIPAWPIHEIHCAIWIWLGDPEKADTALIPDLSYLADAPSSAFSEGMLTGKGHYELFVDNLMDLSHTDYLHPTTLGGGVITQVKPQVVEADDHIEVTWRANNAPPSPLLRKLFSDVPEKTDFVQSVRWFAPSVIKLMARSGPDGASTKDAFLNINAHIITPETPTSSHYFFAATRNYKVDDANLNAMIAQKREEIFATEDKPMIAAIQGRMGEAEFWSLEPRMLTIDAGPIAVRRRMKKLIDIERQAMPTVA